MKNSNGVEIANGANGVEIANANGANAVEIANGANVGTISILPGHTVTFAAAINGPVIITNNNGISLNIQGALAPSIITSFDDHLEVHPLGQVEEV